MTIEANPTICCCSPLTSAGINTGFQLLFNVIGLCSASLVLSHEHFRHYVGVMIFSARAAREEIHHSVSQATTPVVWTPQSGQLYTAPAPPTQPPLPTPPPPPTPFPPPVALPPPNYYCVPQPCAGGYAQYTASPDGQEHHPHNHQHFEPEEDHSFYHYHHTSHNVHNHNDRSSGQANLQARRAALIDAAAELAMTCYIGFAGVWLLTLVGVCLSVRFHRPVLVVPNLVALCTGLFFNSIAFGSLFARTLSSHHTHHHQRSRYHNEHVEHLFEYVMCAFFVIWLINFIFIHTSMHYYSFLVRKHNASLKRVYPATLSRAHSIENDVEKT